MDKSIANPENPDPAKVISRTSACIRGLMDAGLTYEDLQKPINDPILRERLVDFWKSRGGKYDRHINCNKDPFVPSGGEWSVEYHRKHGWFEYDPDKIILFLPKRQYESRINGHELRKELEGQPVLNACVLSYLHLRQALVPTSWMRKHPTFSVYFWGTIYRLPHGLCVRSLTYSNVSNDWMWAYNMLDSDFHLYQPAAILAQE